MKSPEVTGTWTKLAIQREFSGKKNYISFSPQLLANNFSFSMKLRDKMVVIFTVNNDKSQHWKQLLCLIFISLPQTKLI